MTILCEKIPDNFVPFVWVAGLEEPKCGISLCPDTTVQWLPFLELNNQFHVQIGRKTDKLQFNKVRHFAKSASGTRG